MTPRKLSRETEVHKISQKASPFGWRTQIISYLIITKGDTQVSPFWQKVTLLPKRWHVENLDDFFFVRRVIFFFKILKIYKLKIYMIFFLYGGYFFSKFWNLTSWKFRCFFFCTESKFFQNSENFLGRVRFTKFLKKRHLLDEKHKLSVIL